MNRLIIISILCIFSFSNQLFAQKRKSPNKKDLTYQIIFNLPGIPDTVLLLANYYGEHTYLRDTLYPTKKNPYSFILEGTDTLKRGVYILAGQNNVKYMEFLVDSSFFFTVQSKELNPNNPNVSNNVSFINSPENELFYAFTSYMITQQIAGSTVNKKIKEEQAKASPDNNLIESYRSQIKTIYDSMQTYSRQFIENHPTNLFAKAQKLNQEVKIPEVKPESYPDSNWKYQYYFEHYWDNCDFSEEALVYTPVFASFLNQYYEKVMHPAIDSIIKHSDILINKSKDNPELFKYIVWYLSNRYERSKYLGHDAIFVHLIRNYYEKGLCPWVDETVLENMIERANILEPILLGKVAPWLIMPDIDGAFHTNYDFKTDYTIMYFWDTDCGHCKTTTPKLLELYNRAKDSLSLDIFAICLTADSVKWKNYLREKKLPWINVGNNKANIDFREAYDIKSSPKIFVLDKNKRIIVKNIDIDELENFIINHKKGLIKF
ncbi:MAG: DUF5106 domain-containing protein [Bacteroidales bacterium]|nr:DUF5106 domain-containing protein [Bacteroidales bacterium]